MLLLLMRFIGMKSLELIALKVIFGVVLAIGFDDDDIIENAESYVFSIINVNKIPSPRDLEMRDTVVLIIENFFNMNEAALL